MVALKFILLLYCFQVFFGAPNIWLIYNCEFNIILTHSLIQYLTLPATPPPPVALAAGVRFIHKARLYEREIKDSLSPITRIVTVCAQRQDAQYTEQVAQLVESIKQFGWTNPVLIDEKGEIIAGHGRVMAAEMLKMDSVPVIVLAGDTTYREWFLRQPYTRQKQIVGETRAKLIRDGGMSPDEFYTDKGEWLTLKQLRERDAQVFRKAGI